VEGFPAAGSRPSLPDMTKRILLIAGFTLLSGCSSGGGSGGAPTSDGGGGTGGGGNASADCSSACQRAAEASCPNDQSVEDCKTDCTQDLAPYVAACPSQSSAFFACAATAQFRCDSDGEAEPTGCDAQGQAFFRCAACVQTPTDDACDTCLKTKCCEALKGGDFQCIVTNCGEVCQEVGGTG
jgi:hypothetical protein